jgi:hypothetical protein
MMHRDMKLSIRTSLDLIAATLVLISTINCYSVAVAEPNGTGGGKKSVKTKAVADAVAGTQGKVISAPKQFDDKDTDKKDKPVYRIDSSSPSISGPHFWQEAISKASEQRLERCLSGLANEGKTITTELRDELVARNSEEVRKLEAAMWFSVLREFFPHANRDDLLKVVEQDIQKGDAAAVIDRLFPKLVTNDPDTYQQKLNELKSHLDSSLKKFIEDLEKSRNDLKLKIRPKSYPPNESDRNDLWGVAARFSHTYSDPSLSALQEEQSSSTKDGKINPPIYTADNGYRINPLSATLGDHSTKTGSFAITFNQDGQILSGKVQDHGDINWGLLADGRYIYAVDRHMNLIIGLRGAERMPHPTLIGGLDPRVYTAGEVQIQSGRIIVFDNMTGHFAVDFKSLKFAKQALDAAWRNWQESNGVKADSHYEGVSTVPWSARTDQ